MEDSFISPYRDDIVISWPELHRDTRVLCRALMEKGPFRGIIAIARGGMIPMIPMQDWLGLGSEARMNTPATLGGGNWEWRMKSGAADAGLAARIRRLTELTER